MEVVSIVHEESGNGCMYVLFFLGGSSIEDCLRYLLTMLDDERFLFVLCFTMSGVFKI